MCGPLHAKKLAAVAPVWVQDVGKPSHSYAGTAAFVHVQERQMYSCQVYVLVWLYQGLSLKYFEDWLTFISSVTPVFQKPLC